MARQKLSAHKSAKLFARTANRTRKANLSERGALMRGGIRL